MREGQKERQGNSSAQASLLNQMRLTGFLTVGTFWATKQLNKSVSCTETYNDLYPFRENIYLREAS